MGRSEILTLCDEISKKGSLASLEDLEFLLSSLNKLREKPVKSRKKRDRRLFKGLGVALAFFGYGSKSSTKKRQMDNLLKRHSILGAKIGKNPCLPYVKVCVPGKLSRDYDRYAKAVRIAEDQGLRPTKFYKTLKRTKGGMTGYIEGNEANRGF
ncbi:MAG: hypothetical protein H8E36_13780 [Rhodospirillaceae bacterium]|nr:hypothetical protein [Rhodospirillaceae bacterium]